MCIRDRDYSIREISPSEGYLLDETVYPVGAEPGTFELENNSIPMTAKEDVILGSIAITKHTDQPAIPEQEEPVPQLEAPAEESNSAESAPSEDVPTEEPAESSSAEETPVSSSSEIPESAPVPKDESASSSQPEESAESEVPAESAEEQPAESTSVPESQPASAESTAPVLEIVPTAANGSRDEWQGFNPHAKGTITYAKTGHSIGYFNLIKTDGVFQSQHRLKRCWETV